MAKLYILIGFVGSGKSTWARNLCSNQEETIIVNRDSIRTMFFGKYGYKPEVENTVKIVASYCVTSLLNDGFNVIVDEPNLTKNKRTNWIDITRPLSIPIEIKYIWFTESVECLENRMKDDARGLSKEYWAEVIEGMKKTFEPPTPEEFEQFGLVPDIQRVSISSEYDDGWIAVDLDGVLARYEGWKGETEIGEPVPLMVNHVRMWVASGRRVKIFTARAATPAGKTAVEEWLQKNNLPALEVTNAKDYKMRELYDDRAYRVEKNTGLIQKINHYR